MFTDLPRRIATKANSSRLSLLSPYAPHDEVRYNAFYLLLQTNINRKALHVPATGGGGSVDPSSTDWKWIVRAANGCEPVG